MDELAKLIASPAWWFTAVIVGLTCSVAAAYLKDALDRWRVRGTNARARRAQLEASERKLRRDIFRADQELRLYERTRLGDEIASRQRFLIASLAFGVALPHLAIAAALPILSSLLSLSAAVAAMVFANSEIRSRARADDLDALHSEQVLAAAHERAAELKAFAAPASMPSSVGGQKAPTN
jgi:hypothetical protein